MLGCHFGSFVLHCSCCVFRGLVLHGVHLVWLMGCILLLVGFSVVLFVFLIV